MRAGKVVLICTSAALMANPAAAFDAKTEGAKLLQRDAEWAALASEGRDVEKTASYWTDDAIIVAPALPIVEGKAAIHAFVAGSFETPGFHIHWVSEKPVFSPDGNLAYLRSVTTTTVPGADGKPMTISSRGVTVWRRDTDGQWRCAVDIWNDAPQEPGQPK